MQRVCQAPNIMIAQLWVDMLRDQGVQASMQRYYMSSVAGEIPPDQCLPEIWVLDDAQLEQAKSIMGAVASLSQRNWWLCAACGEHVEGGFDYCWSCGSAMPPE
jgi:Putative prokaryotic signal transducing protein